MPSPVTALIAIDVQEALFQPEPRRFEADATRPASGAGLVGHDRRLSARIFPRQTAGSRHREST